MGTNMAQAMANAAANAKSPNALEQRNQAAANQARVASSKDQPMPATNDDVLAKMAAMEANMARMMALVEQKDAQIAELKAAKPAGKVKAEKPAATPENESITVKGNILTITVDLSKNTGKHTANGANLIVAQQNSAVGPYKFEYAGKAHWLSCMVCRPEENASELRKAYKASKASK